MSQRLRCHVSCCATYMRALYPLHLMLRVRKWQKDAISYEQFCRYELGK